MSEEIHRGRANGADLFETEMYGASIFGYVLKRM